MLIKGPDGRTAEVDEENRLTTFAITETLDGHVNKHGGVFSIYFKVTPVAVGGYFFYLKNNGLLDLSITSIRISSTVPNSLYYQHVLGNPIFVTGTPAEIDSRNLGSAIELDVEAIYDTDITGIVDAGVLFFEKLPIANERYNLSSTSNLIIPQGQAMAFRIEDAVGEIEAIVSAMVGT